MKNRPSQLSDKALLLRVAEIVRSDWVNTAELLLHLAEVDKRRLYLQLGYSTMYLYCMHELRMSEDTAYRRIGVARTARDYPAIYPALAEGRLNLTSVLLLGPHLTPGNAEGLLAAAVHKTKDEIRLMLAERFPRPDVPTVVREIPAALALERVTPQVSQSLTSRPSFVPLSAERVALQATIPASLLAKIRYAEALLSHTDARGDIVKVLERAVDELIEVLEKRKLGTGSRSRPRGGKSDPRIVPPAVRKAVWLRDGGQCTFVGDNGHRCEARDRLEFDHILTVARGGQPTVDELRLLCRAHNQHAAEQTFGPEFMKHKREQAKAKFVPHSDLVAALRRLEYRGNQLREASMLAEAKRDRPVEEQLRYVLQRLAPKCRRDPAPTVSSPAPA